MPGLPPRPIIGHPNAMLPHLGKGENGPNEVAPGPSIHPTRALTGWHDFNMSVAHALPTALLRAGRYEHAALLALRHRGRVR